MVTELVLELVLESVLELVLDHRSTPTLFRWCVDSTSHRRGQGGPLPRSQDCYHTMLGLPTMLLGWGSAEVVVLELVLELVLDHRSMPTLIRWCADSTSHRRGQEGQLPRSQDCCHTMLGLTDTLAALSAEEKRGNCDFWHPDSH